MSKFKAGEKVAYYGNVEDEVGRFVLTVHGIENTEGMLRLNLPDGGYIFACPEQCRRLKPRKRMTVWVSPDFRHFNTTKVGPDWIEFREARSGEVKND